MASVRKRDKHDSDSPWVCEYTDAAGKRRRYTPKTGLKKDADAFRRKVEGELERGEHTAARASALVREVTTRFMRHTEDRMRDGRIGRSRYNILGYACRKFEAHLGARIFSEVTAADLEALYTAMCRADGMQPASARSWIKTFGQVEIFAKGYGFTRKFVTPDALAALRGIKRRKIRRFNVDQIYSLLNAACRPKPGGQERSHCLLNCYIYLAALSGLRFGEINGLTVQNVDMDARVIRVRHNLTAFGELKGPKSEAGVRDFPMLAPVHALLRVWLDRFHVPNDRDLLFGSKRGLSIAQSNFRKTFWLPLLAAAGLRDDDDPYHFHALRGFAASWMFASGFGLNEVPALLGHKTVDTTLQHYTHSVVDSGRHREMLDKAVSGLLVRPEAAPFGAAVP